jgi:hypothetical protein
VRGLFDRLSGKAKETRRQNETEAFKAFKRDKDQKQALIEAQMRERQALQDRMIKLRDKHKAERANLARDVMGVMRMKAVSNKPKQQTEQTQQRRRRDRGFEIS